MKDDPIDDFLEYDFTVGADEVKCPHCGESISCSMFLGEDEIECPKCGERFRKTNNV